MNAPRIRKGATVSAERPDELAPQAAFADDQIAQEGVQREGVVAEGAAQVMAEDAVGQHQQRDQRQHDVDRAPRHLQRDGDQHDRHRHLQRALQRAVLVGQRGVMGQHVGGAGAAQRCAGPAEPTRRLRGGGGEDEDPRQRQQEVQRPRDQVRDQPREDEIEVEADRERAEQRQHPAGPRHAGCARDLVGEVLGAWGFGHRYGALAPLTSPRCPFPCSSAARRGAPRRPAA